MGRNARLPNGTAWRCKRISLTARNARRRRRATPAVLQAGCDAGENGSNSARYSIRRGSDAGARRDIVAANAGAALYIAGIVPTLPDGVRLAGVTLQSGAAGAKLDALVEWTNRKDVE